ncbi:MAG: RnfABCDGE type electron transport complex subunit D [Rectinemataceae bacterium]
MGLTVVVIRSFSAFSEGTSFAILFGNTFATLIDMGVDGMKKPAAPAKGGAK